VRTPRTPGDSERYLNDSFEGNAEIGDYFLLNLGAGLKGERWEVRVFVNNVTDEVAVLDIFGNGADPQHKLTVDPMSGGRRVPVALSLSGTRRPDRGSARVG
jgi:outer membrane receptor protein involved in Fe transport